MILERELREVAAAFGDARTPVASELFLAALVGQVARDHSPGLALSVELVYEGYLAHYRTSRVLPADIIDADRLLAGDYFYAHGLRDIAAAGDVEGVDLLARLMASCSFLRLEEAAWSVDDDLWELTVTAVAAGDGSGARDAAGRAFAAVGAAVSAGDVDAAGAAAAAGLATVRGAVGAAGARGTR